MFTNAKGVRDIMLAITLITKESDDDLIVTIPLPFRDPLLLG